MSTSKLYLAAALVIPAKFQSTAPLRRANHCRIQRPYAPSYRPQRMSEAIVTAALNILQPEGSSLPGDPRMGYGQVSKCPAPDI